ncbi:MAG TPA: hypothetical protein VK157_07260 [Phycisphaerales bacterium]|nr:hypothetical protein [Phycisphaerales bacterium]
MSALVSSASENFSHNACWSLSDSACLPSMGPAYKPRLWILVNADNHGNRDIAVPPPSSPANGLSRVSGCQGLPPSDAVYRKNRPQAESLQYRARNRFVVQAPGVNSPDPKFHAKT